MLVVVVGGWGLDRPQLTWDAPGSGRSGSWGSRPGTGSCSWWPVRVAEWGLDRPGCGQPYAAAMECTLGWEGVVAAHVPLQADANAAGRSGQSADLHH